MKIIEDEGVEILSKDNPESFAEEILKLLNNKEMAHRFGERGLKLVKTERNWDESAKKLLQKYKAIS